MTSPKLIEKCLLTDKELRKMAHEYFKVGNRKNSLQAGHWIDFVKHQNRNQLTKAIPILADKIKRELEVDNESLRGALWWQNFWRK